MVGVPIKCVLRTAQIAAAACKITFVRNATWTLSNLCRGKPIPDFKLVAPALPTLAQLIYSGDEEILTDALWALSYLSDGDNDKVQMVLEAGAVSRVVELMVHRNASISTPALRTVGNIVTGDEVQTQVVINANALSALSALMKINKKGVRKEACWTVSNIMAGSKEQIQAVLDHNILQLLISHINAASYEVRKECCWAISNACSGIYLHNHARWYTLARQARGVGIGVVGALLRQL
jgi:importin subunit alpha-1